MTFSFHPEKSRHARKDSKKIQHPRFFSWVGGFRAGDKGGRGRAFLEKGPAYLGGGGRAH
jgi:hypothetical protein